MMVINQLRAKVVLLFPLIGGALFLSSILSVEAKSQTAIFSCPDLAKNSENSYFGQPVYQGKNGWFFRETELTHFFPITDDNFSMLKKMNAILNIKGANIFLLPIPTRGIMGKKFLLSDGVLENQYIYDEAFAEEEFRTYFTLLTNQGLKGISLLDYLDQHPDLDRSDYFFPNDIHWTIKGSLWSAEAAAETIKPKLKLDSNYVIDYNSVDLGTKRILDSRFTVALNEGCNDKIPWSYIENYQTKNESQSLDSFLVDENQTSAPIILLGTSFSSDEEPFHFAGFLRSRLKLEVGNFSVPGGGMDQSLFDWSHKQDWKNSGVQAVLWELPYIDRMPHFPEQSARQIIPALAGLCTGTPNAVQELAYDKKNTVMLEVSKTGISGSRFYLASDLSDASMRAPIFKLTYADGTQEEFSPHRPDRVQKVDKLFWELSDLYTGDLKTIEIEFEPNKAETGTLAICKYPDSVIPQAIN